MRIILLVIVFVSFTISAQISPNVEWQRVVGGTSTDDGYGIHQTTDGGYIMAGITNSSDGDVSGNHGNYDGWVVKLSASGVIQWQKALGGTDIDYVESIQQTAEGGYILMGSTYSNDGDVSGNHGGSDAWVVKLSVEGSIQWQRTFGGTTNDIGKSIRQTSDGGYVLAGAALSNDGDVSGNHGGFDAWAVKLSNAGVIQWQHALGGADNDIGYSIQETTDGGYIMLSHTSSNDGDVSENQGGVDAWVVKLSISGAIQWQKSLGGTNNEFAYCIDQTSDGGYVFTGSTYSNDGDIPENQGGSDSWVVKLSASGQIQWQKVLGGTSNDDGYCIQQTADGGYVLAGGTQSNDGDVLEYQGGVDAWVVKLSASAEIEWQKALGGASDENFFSIHETTDGGYIMAGITASDDGDVPVNNGGSDAWVVKFDISSLDDTVFDQAKIEVYPNPTIDVLNIRTPKNVVLDKITITDLTGKTVMEQTQNTNQISVEKLSIGVYILNGYSGEDKFQEKFLKE